ncbi:MAG: hypothetical protein WCJ95_16140 [Mariniphaga sp.]
MFNNIRQQKDTIELLQGLELITMELDGEKTDANTQVRQMALSTPKSESIAPIRITICHGAN